MFYTLLPIVVALLVQCSAADLPGCPPGRQSGEGFVAKFFKLPLGQEIASFSNFFQSSYKDLGYLGQTEVADSTSFNLIETLGSHEETDVIKGSIYDYPITTSNFTMELTGYYLADQTGVHHFEFLANGGWAFSLGSGDKCFNDASASVSGQVDHYKVVDPLHPDDWAYQVVSYNLVKGRYYPVKFIFLNRKAKASLITNVILPDGEILNDMVAGVFQLDFDDEAPAPETLATTITTAWNRDYEETKTFQGIAASTVVVFKPSYPEERKEYAATESPESGEEPREYAAPESSESPDDLYSLYMDYFSTFTEDKRFAGETQLTGTHEPGPTEAPREFVATAKAPGELVATNTPGAA